MTGRYWGRALVCRADLTAPLERLAFVTVCLALLFAFMASPARAATPLVTPQWLQANIELPDLRILDLQPPAGYARAHLPGSINSQYQSWRHKKPFAGKALPDIAFLERMLGELGIGNDTHVILAPIGANASEIAVATRIYWTFKVLGHERVSILDGGLIAYSKLPGAKFTRDRPDVDKVQYTAKPDFTLAPGAKEVLAEWEKGTGFIDHRSPEEYLGQVRAQTRGTIPGSKNLPYHLLVGAEPGGAFLSAEKAMSLYEAQGIDIDKPAIAFCQSGHRASLAWFVAHEVMGKKNVRLYDGSMAEWGQYPGHPIAIPDQ